MSAGNDPDELKGCRGIVLGIIAGAALWLSVVGGIIWLTA